MRILVVDDELEKARRVAEVLQKATLVADVAHQSTAHGARQTLRLTHFDLLLIDLNLPDGITDKPSRTGGLDLFDMLFLDTAVKLPGDVVFITALPEPLNELRRKVHERGAVLWTYASSDVSWVMQLIGRVKYISKRLSRETRKVDIAIVTALRNPELDAVLALPYGWTAARFDGDPTGYHFGQFTRPSGDVVTVVAANAQRKGMPSSAALASKLALQFKPQYLVMTGMCAGIEGKVNFGDVVVANPTWDYGSGKRTLDHTDSPVFKSAPYQVTLNASISQVADELGRDAEVIREIRSGWSEAAPKGVLAVHVGPMASGASVIADDSEARRVLLQHRDLIAIEMEAYGVMAAAEYSGGSKPIAIAIKSVCDFADNSKSDEWQRYASYTSAAFANILFRSKHFSIAR